MDKLTMKAYDKELMKMAMLKHEETFRRQVYELHRLYQIQKTLMQNIPPSAKTKGQNQETYFDYHNHTTINNNLVYIEQQADGDINVDVDDQGVVNKDEDEIENEMEIELTLAPSSFYRRRSKALNSDSALSISSSSSGSSSHHIKRSGQRSKPENVTRHTWGFVEVPDVSNLNLFSGRKNHLEEQMRQSDRVKQQEQPPWLYQVVSLNMT